MNNNIYKIKNGINYLLQNNDDNYIAVACECLSKNKDIVVLDKIIEDDKVYVVKSILSNCFNNLNIEKIWLPYTLETIEDNAFVNCNNLVEIYNSSSIEISFDSLFKYGLNESVSSIINTKNKNQFNISLNSNDNDYFDDIEIDLIKQAYEDELHAYTLTRNSSAFLLTGISLLLAVIVPVAKYLIDNNIYKFETIFFSIISSALLLVAFIFSITILVPAKVDVFPRRSLHEEINEIGYKNIKREQFYVYHRVTESYAAINRKRSKKIKLSIYLIIGSIFVIAFGFTFCFIKNIL